MNNLIILNLISNLEKEIITDIIHFTKKKPSFYNNLDYKNYMVYL